MIQNMEQYKVFYYVASYQSLSKAANALSITQPAVSQAMKGLENMLGIKLFIRTSRGIRLTKEGEVLFEYVRVGYEQFELGEQMLQKLAHLETGELHIGASDMTLQYYLLPYLEIFHEKYPNIKVYVSNGPTPETLKRLSDGEIDFALVSTPVVVDDRFDVIHVREIEDVFVAGHRYIQLKNHMTDFSQLLDFPIISLEKNTSTRRYMDQLLEKEGIVLNPEFELANSDMIVQFAVRNLGIGCVVEDFAKPYIDSGKLFSLRFNKMIPKRHICVVRDKRVPFSFTTKGLFEIMNIPKLDRE